MALSVVGLVVIGAGVVGWRSLVHGMSDPGSVSLAVGLRIDGARVSVKVPACPTEAVDKVEVFDGEREKPLWEARAPKSPQGKRGALTLWAADEYEHPGPGGQPALLPKSLDVAVTGAGGEGGGGGNFDTAVVMAAKLPDGHYWTSKGPMTAEAIDGQLTCGASGRPSA
ncbi:hypothetical protein O1L60_40250 [Streptomyces diastatochromogenes]|nr:hypothetical protein [Streptomyces diastatochromogenes]